MMNCRYILPTGQSRCYDENGRQVDRVGTGQGGKCLADESVIDWPANRFVIVNDELAGDRVTGLLLWARNSCLTGFPLTWQEALEFVEETNHEAWYGRSDWHMSDRCPLRSLIDHSGKNRALTPGHPFQDVFLGWYRTSTTAAIATRYARYVHLEGGRMFYGNKDEYSWLWPVLSLETG